LGARSARDDRRRVLICHLLQVCAAEQKAADSVIMTEKTQSELNSAKRKISSLEADVATQVARSNVREHDRAQLEAKFEVLEKTLSAETKRLKAEVSQVSDESQKASANHKQVIDNLREQLAAEKWNTVMLQAAHKTKVDNLERRFTDVCTEATAKDDSQALTIKNLEKRLEESGRLLELANKVRPLQFPPARHAHVTLFGH